MTATGWTFEYVDHLGFDRGTELIEYLAERNDPEEPPMMITDEGSLFELQKMLGDGERPASVGGMSAEFRDAIRWGEEMRKKHRLGSSAEVQDYLSGNDKVN